MPLHLRPLPALTPAQIARFWSHVDKAGPLPPHRPELGPCWVWTGGADAKGYGLFTVDGRPFRAHRLACVLIHGPLAAQQLALHDCDYPPCVRHVRPGTQRENMRDRSERGRHWRGGADELVRLTEADRLAIRAELGVSRDTERIRALAQRYGYTQRTICLASYGHWQDGALISVPSWCPKNLQLPVP